MTLRLPDKWVWDFWLVRDDTDYHAFYLQAPRSLGNPDLRHLNASIGHAVSRDLRHWRVLPDALRAGPPGAWDDCAVWTGCVVWAEGRWHMFYTGVSVEGHTVVQRAGSAMSKDLIRWRKHPHNPLIEADPRYYEQRGEDAAGYERMWRDPWVFRHRQKGDYHSAARRKETRLEPVGGTHYLVAEDPLGPFRFSTHDFLIGDPAGSLYSGKLIDGPDGRPNFLAWRNFTPDGAFVGELAEPFEIAVDGEGNLSVLRTLAGE